MKRRNFLHQSTALATGGLLANIISASNKVQASYSLTAFSPYEGYRIAFNGTKRKLDAWIKEAQPWEEPRFDKIQFTSNFGKREVFQIPNNEQGHGDGDARLRKQTFTPDGKDPYNQLAGSRDGALSILVGIAARNSIDSELPVKVGALTSIKPNISKSGI